MVVLTTNANHVKHVRIAKHLPGIPMAPGISNRIINGVLVMERAAVPRIIVVRRDIMVPPEMARPDVPCVRWTIPRMQHPRPVP